MKKIKYLIIDNVEEYNVYLNWNWVATLNTMKNAKLYVTKVLKGRYIT